MVLAYFYPRPPRGGRPSTAERIDFDLVFLSTPSARRATGVVIFGGILDNISIHALREEGDGLQIRQKQAARHFYPRPPRGGRRNELVDSRPGKGISIHALREEGDPGNRPGDRGYGIFLSTPSARRATGTGTYLYKAKEIFLSTPSARRATTKRRFGNDSENISIHALREEGD